MSSYLEAYGRDEERRARRLRLLKVSAVSLLAALAAGAALYFTFRNFREERRVRQFLALLDRRQYRPAYSMWGCTEAAPCRDYSFEKFLDDWGPKSAFSNGGAAALAGSESCGSGVLIPVSAPRSSPVALWVERDTHLLSYSPWPQCPGRHWRFKAFFKSLTGG